MTPEALTWLFPSPHYFPESRKKGPVIVVSTTYTYSFLYRVNTLILT